MTLQTLGPAFDIPLNQNNILFEQTFLLTAHERKIIAGTHTRPHCPSGLLEVTITTISGSDTN